MLESIQNLWNSFLGFLAEYDSQKIAEIVRQLEWGELITNPLLWLAVLAIVLLSVWKRRISYLVLVCSFILFVVLLQDTLPPPGESVPLSSILEFIGGSVLLFGLNMYFLIIREK